MKAVGQTYIHRVALSLRWGYTQGTMQNHRVTLSLRWEYTQGTMQNQVTHTKHYNRASLRWGYTQGAMQNQITHTKHDNRAERYGRCTTYTSDDYPWYRKQNNGLNKRDISLRIRTHTQEFYKTRTAHCKTRSARGSLPGLTMS